MEILDSKRTTAKRQCSLDNFFRPQQPGAPSDLSTISISSSPESDGYSSEAIMLCDSSNSSTTGPAPTIVSIDETYQLGIQALDDVYLLENADNLELSYPVSMTENVTPETLEQLPLSITGEDFASDLLCQLADRLSSWMDALDDFKMGEFTTRQLAAYDELTVLRRQVFFLISNLMPDVQLPHPQFDCTTGDLDRLLTRITCELKGAPEVLISTPSDGGDVFVNLGTDGSCASVTDALRQRVLTLLRIILPRLKLPDTFDLSRDLPDLINAVYSYNVVK